MGQQVASCHGLASCALASQDGGGFENSSCIGLSSSSTSAPCREAIPSCQFYCSQVDETELEGNDPICNLERGIPEQDHCFAFEDELDDVARLALNEQYDNLRPPEDVWEAFKSARAERHENKAFFPPEFMRWSNRTSPVPRKGANVTFANELGTRRCFMWRSAGFRLIRKSRLAVVLYCEPPKEACSDVNLTIMDIGLLSGKSIFQLYMERIRRLKHLAARSCRNEASSSFVVCSIPIYAVFTDLGIAESAEEFVRENDCFGLPGEDIRFLVQDHMPLIDGGGRYLLRNKGELWTGSCGDGGVFMALRDKGVLADMRKRMVERVFMCSMRNLVARIGDPLLLGYAERLHADVVVKCVERLNGETDGRIFGTWTFPMRDGSCHEDLDFRNAMKKAKARIGLVSELTFTQIVECLPYSPGCSNDGFPRMAFCAEPIDQLAIDLPMVEVAAREFESMFWCVSEEIVDCVSIETGNVKPNVPALRLFQEAHSIVSLVNTAMGLVCNRQDEVALVWEESTRWTIQAAVLGMATLHQRWLIKGGARFVDDMRVDRYGASLCEVSPLVSFAGEGIAQYYQDEMTLPLHLPSRFESIPLKSAAPLPSSLASNSPTMPSFSGTVADAPCVDLGNSRLQVPLHVARSRENNKNNCGRGSDSSSDDDTGFVGTTAPSKQQLNVDPALEDFEFKLSQGHVAQCRLIVKKLLSGAISRADLAEEFASMQAFVVDSDKVTEDVEVLPVEQSDEEDEEEVEAEVADVGQMHDDLESCFSDSDDLQTEEQKKRKARDKSFFFCQRGPRMHIYEGARAVRTRREKVFRKGCVNPRLQSPEKPSRRRVERSYVLKEMYKRFDPATVHEDSWRIHVQGRDAELNCDMSDESDSGEDEVVNAPKTKSDFVEAGKLRTNNRRGGVAATVPQQAVPGAEGAFNHLMAAASMTNAYAAETQPGLPRAKVPARRKKAVSAFSVSGE
eukprot:TRINITY_DN10591_c0_g1_i1.p1 TRINITY_DN10591_c0_g1~~TRINITY_DN10591_c0_g1_i1.p1  ORF type:complete len:963 (-),score=170.01 TRINITY_DN10591_c0_g1_i1:32-2920(-)